MKSTESTYETRRSNLSILVMEKFRGNKAALARAAGVHQNHVNLILSQNKAHTRNLGEGLARRIEQTLGLPPRWFDTPHDGALSEAVVPVDAALIHGSMAGAIRTCDSFHSVSFKLSQLTDLNRRVTAVENLLLATVDTVDMEPELRDGDAVIFDTAVKAFTGDGIYILAKQDGPAMLRRIKRGVTGELLMAQGGLPAVEVSEQSMAKFGIMGKIIDAVHMRRV